MRNKLNIKTLTYASLFTALISVLAQISIPVPFSPVPFTGQTLAVILAGLILTPLEAGLSMIVYILLAAIGIPVLAGGRSGLSTIVGPTGGYILGFAIATLFISALRGKNYSLSRYIIVSIIGGIIIVHLLGFPYLSFTTGMTLKKAFMVGSLPYLLFDLLKAILASYIAIKVNKQLRDS